jgi:hypothetical protein
MRTCAGRTAGPGAKSRIILRDRSLGARGGFAVVMRDVGGAIAAALEHATNFLSSAQWVLPYGDRIATNCGPRSRAEIGAGGASGYPRISRHTIFIFGNSQRVRQAIETAWISASVRRTFIELPQRVLPLRRPHSHQLRTAIVTANWRGCEGDIRRPAGGPRAARPCRQGDRLLAPRRQIGSAIASWLIL